MKKENMSAVARTMVRETALGLSPKDIHDLHPEFSVEQICKMQRGQTFRRALGELQERLDEEVVASSADDNTMRFIKGKAKSMAEQLASIATHGENEGARVSAAKDILDRAGYGGRQEKDTSPVLMINAHTLNAVLSAGASPVAIPSKFDGHSVDINQFLCSEGGKQDSLQDSLEPMEEDSCSEDEREWGEEDAI